MVNVISYEIILFKKRNLKYVIVDFVCVQVELCYENVTPNYSCYVTLVVSLCMILDGAILLYTEICKIFYCISFSNGRQCTELVWI